MSQGTWRSLPNSASAVGTIAKAIESGSLVNSAEALAPYAGVAYCVGIFPLAVWRGVADWRKDDRDWGAL
jgi:hypothetical protein